MRPCLMATATTGLALIPILTSNGRGSDIMVPMAIPSFGGMIVVGVSIFRVPVLYGAVKEFGSRTELGEAGVGALSILSVSLVPVLFCALSDRLEQNGPEEGV